MAGTGANAGRRRRRRPWLVACVTSVALHAAVLAVLVQRRMEEAPPPPTTIEVTLIQPAQPRPDAEPQPARTAPAAAAEPFAAERTRAVRPGAPAPPAPFTRPVFTAPSPGAASAPAGAGPVGPPAPSAPVRSAPQPPRTASPGDSGERLRSFLRSVGCDPGTARLTARERERCQERLGAARGGVLPSSRSVVMKRDAWDDARDPTPNAYNALRAGDIHCEGLDGCLGPAPKGVAFGKPPKALPNIPASTLRGDDDALRPKAKPKPGD